MINQTQLRYGREKMRQRLEKEKEEERRRRQINNRIYKSFQSVTEIPDKVVDMKEALEEVRKKSYITHPESYAKLTGGYSPLKNMKTK